ncbi:MAG: ATP-binding protein, partial [Promethearchaeota archaeon]
VLEQARRKQKGLNNVINHYQYRLIKKTGEIIWVENYSKTIQYMGRPADLITIIDITKQKNAEEIIRKENTKYKEFLDTASHEFKTPLTSIYGATELLIKAHKDEMSAEVLELIEIAHHGSKKLKNLILNILDVSRMETGVFKFKKERINLVKVVKECVKDLKYLLKRRQHVIYFDLPNEIYLIADKVKIERVIMNLLSNAIKYTPPKGKITINLLKNESYVKINISDSGIGLTDTEIGNLFEKFSRIQRTSDEEEDLIMDGTGLGLYISKEIVELHGGKIYVKSEGKNKGSTFTVQLPIN